MHTFVKFIELNTFPLDKYLFEEWGILGKFPKRDKRGRPGAGHVLPMLPAVAGESPGRPRHYLPPPSPQGGCFPMSVISFLSVYMGVGMEEYPTETYIQTKPSYEKFINPEHSFTNWKWLAWMDPEYFLCTCNLQVFKNQFLHLLGNKTSMNWCEAKVSYNLPLCGYTWIALQNVVAQCCPNSARELHTECAAYTLCFLSKNWKCLCSKA